MKHEWTTGLPFALGRDEARVGAHVHEPAAGAQHAVDLGEGSRRVIKVGVGQHGYDRIERTGRKGQATGVSLESVYRQTSGPFASDTQLISRNIEACHRPTCLGQIGDCDTCAAADIETLTGTRTKEVDETLEGCCSNVRSG